MRRILILLTLFTFSDLVPVTAGTPGMLIRCRQNALQFLGEPCDMPGFITYEGHCYPLADAGMCPEVPPFVSLVTMDVMIDGETFTICIPDCSLACAESCEDGTLFWDPVEQGCVCDDDVDPFLCGCPAPLVETIAIGPLANIIDGMGYCSLPEQDCYNLGIDYVVEPFICDGPNPSDTITITIKPAGGGIFNPFEDALTIEDLQNCELIDGTGELLTVVGLFGEDDRFAFVADENGCIVIEFIRDPTQDAIISFLGENNETIVIPACPRAFDPCSCRDENITDPDNIVLYWYDELTFTGTPNSLISVQSNNIPEGFLDNLQSPYAGPIGTTDAMGLLNVPFFRTPGFDTDVVLVDPNNMTATLNSSCGLPANICARIVPTLGEWSIIVLALILMILGVTSFHAIQKRAVLNG